jgi:hypothetical protein
VAFLRDDRRGDGIGRRASKSDYISRFMFIITVITPIVVNLLHQLSLRLSDIQSASP